jgi:hypothetical protein
VCSSDLDFMRVLLPAAKIMTAISFLILLGISSLSPARFI